MTVQTPINGVNVDGLSKTIHAVEENPELGQFKFRARNKWLNGGHSRSVVKDFYGAGEENTDRVAPFVLEADEPAILEGEDHGANPVEYVLHALAGCLTSSIVYHAATRGIHIDSIESELEGDLDVRAFMGLSDEVPKGYQNIRVTFKIQSDASPEQLRELADMSPVLDTLTRAVPVSVEIHEK